MLASVGEPEKVCRSLEACGMCNLVTRCGSLDLHPYRVLTAVRERGDEQPDTLAHASGLCVQIELPFSIDEPELVAWGRCVLPGGID